MTETPAEKWLTQTLASLAPIVQPGTFVFCSTLHRGDNRDALSVARAMIVEDEGLSLILPRTEAVRLGLIFDMTMRQITLMVFSALDGVGLTAAVSTALAEAGIPANVVAGANHDHVFVPARQVDAAMEVLRALQKDAQSRLA